MLLFVRMRRLEAEGVYNNGGDIRFVMTTSCQSGCNFCHLEGHKNAGEIGILNEALAGWKTAKKGFPLIERLGRAVGDDDVQSTIRIAQLVGLNKVHLTGGEPTLHPNTPSVIGSFSSSGMEVAMTTHGEISQPLMSRFLTSGLAGINFSIHAIEPSQYLAMDLVAQQIAAQRGQEAGLKYAQSRLNQKLANIALASAYSREYGQSPRIKVNSVVQDVNMALQIVQFCNEQGIDVRVQNDINNKTRSEAMIKEVLARLGARAVREDLAIGDSSGSGVVYNYPGGALRVKSFGEVYVPLMCDPCPLIGASACRERFYGIRIEKGFVTTCIDRQDRGETVFSFGEFINLLELDKGIPAQIRRQYANVRDLVRVS